MAKNANFVSHKKSKQIVDGKPKLPLASDLVEGEIAINFGKDVETLSIKNESGDVVTFSSDNYYTEKKLGSGFTGEHSGVTVTEAIEDSEEVSISSGVTPSGTSIEIWIDESVDPAEADVYTKAQTDSLLNLKLDTSAYTEYWTSGTGENAVVLKNSSGTASGNFSVAEGYKTSATSNSSHAEGQYSKAIGSQSHAEGYQTEASGNSSHAEGQNTMASGDYSHTEGQNTTASGYASHAEGSYTSASGYSSHAEGYQTKAIGDYSHAEGQNTTANAIYSHAEGASTVASGPESHAEGGTTYATNWGAHAEGQNTFATGQRAHAEGSGTQAFGDDTHAEGSHTRTVNNSEHASGQYNVSTSASTEFGNSGNTLFSVGNGTDDNTRHNAFEIRQNGDIYIVNKNGQDVKLQDEIGNITVDQTIDSGTSASTNAVSTSAVYGFVTSYTPSITVDQVLDNTTSASTNPVSSKAVYDAVTDNELVWTNAFVALSGTVSAHTEDTTVHVTAADKAAWNAKLDASAIADFFDDAKYEDSGTTKVINFYHGNTIKATIDASDFIVDGMVDDVKIENGYLVIDFNTASGKQDISIPLTDIFDPSNYYAKSETSGATELATAFDAKANTATTLAGYGITDAYTKSETSGATEISNALGAKVNSATYTGHTADTTIHFTTGAVQTQIDNSISGKSDTGHTHVSNEVTAMTGYAKAASGSSITTSDSLNVAIGKLEAYVDDLNSQSETVAAALVDLYSKIGDIETLLSQI